MIVAATGHRPDKCGGYSPAAHRKRVDLAKWALENLEPEAVISGMALGWDQAVAQAAHELWMPLIAAVPFEGQERMWPADSQRTYRTLMGRAARVHVVSPGGFSKRAMQVRNEWMADECGVMLALWDGSAGGTGNCVRYCEKIGRITLNLWGLDQLTLPSVR